MGNFLYNIALKIVEGHKAKQESQKASDEEAEKKRREEWKRHGQLITKFRNQFIADLERDYAKNNEPKFEVGQKVLMNPYSIGDHWEGSVRSLISHTPFRGPVEVLIDSVGLDSTCLSEVIDKYRENGYLDKIRSELDYERFINIVSDRLNDSKSYQWIMHSYRFHKDGEPDKYWRYPLREDKFVSLHSKAGKAVLKLAKLEAEVEEKKEAAKRAREEYESLEKDFHKQIGITYIE